jgi:hypothetical protein
MGERDRDGKLNMDEFMRLVSLKSGPPRSDRGKQRWYWENFTSE